MLFLIKNGGVGKTTTTLNLGTALARKGKKVLLIDLDPQRSLTISLGYKSQNNINVTIKNLMEKSIQEIPIEKDEGILKNKEGIDLIPSNKDLSSLEMSMIKYINRESILNNYIKQIKQDYDYILIDCSPSLGILTINALAAADSVIIPVQPHYLAIDGMTELIQTIDKTRVFINPKLKIEGILVTLADMKTNLTKTTVKTLKNSYGARIKIYDTVIPLGIKTAESTLEGKSIYSYDKKSKPSLAYEKFAEEVLEDSKRTRATECR